jgi:hypothetical protein
LETDFLTLTNKFVIGVLERSIFDKAFRAKMRITINKISAAIEIFGCE